jgi:hypothetical protein
MPRDLPVAGPSLDHLRGGQPHLLPAGLLRRVQPWLITVRALPLIIDPWPDQQADSTSAQYRMAVGSLVPNRWVS